jgi:hypothetical protein
MVARAAGGLRLNPLKPQLSQVEFLNKGINDSYGVIVCDVVIEPFGK